MNRYQLAKIVEWSGTLRSRKRMQKMVFLLQAAGCPLEADYDLHLYGPYSQDVAGLTDEMAREGLFREHVESLARGEQYSYSLSAGCADQIRQYESEQRGQGDRRRMEAFADLARELSKTDLKELEIGATIAFFRKQGHDWAEAVEQTCRFKELPKGTAFLNRCEELARKIVA